MRKSFVYKLRPNQAQAALLAETLETGRRLYNRALAQRKEAWEQEQRSVRFAAQSAMLPALKQANDYLPRVNAQVLQDVLRRVDRAFQAFFRRCQAGKKPGYPRFRGPGWYDSFCFPQWGGGTKLEAGRLILSRIGSIRLHADRPLQGRPKTCTITHRADGWYATIVCEVEPVPLPLTGEVVGIDLGIECFATLSTGEQIANLKHYHRAERSLKRAQRRVARRKKGGVRRRKARVLLARAHLKVKRARLDRCHKLARELVQRFDVLHVEALNIRGMLKNHPLAKSIADAGWGIFLTVLCSKAASAGKQVVEVNPAGTSQICSSCGQTVPKKLAQRWHSCPYCACSLHRDHNAALNILKKGGGTTFGEPPALAEA